MSWKDVGLGGGGANYLKVSAGEKIMVHVLGEEPHSFEQHFFQRVKKSATCPGEGCPACASGDKEFKKRFVHAMNVYSYRDKGVRIWIMTNDTANQLKNIFEGYQSLEKVDLQVVRTGAGLDTKYNLIPYNTKFDQRLVADGALPVLAEVLKAPELSTIESLMAGVDPAMEFDPGKLEGAPTDSGWGEAAPSNGQLSPAEPTPAETSAWGDEPVQAAPPVAAKVAVKSAPATSERTELLKKVMNKMATHPKLKAAGAKEKFIAHVAKGKKQIAQFDVAELKKALELLK